MRVSYPSCIRSREYSALEWVRLRVASSVEARLSRESLRSVRTFVPFVGYPRSGHTLVGSLLDAHPHAVVAHELGALRFFARGWPAARVWSLVLESARQFGERGRRWEGYSYDVPGAPHGRGDPLLVVGDKKGGGNTRLLAAHPELLDRIEGQASARLRLLHVVRNPFDIVATRHRRTREDVAALTDATVGLLDDVAVLAARAGPDRFLTVRHEDVVADPRASLRRIAAYLDLDPAPEWLEACASIVVGPPRRTRAEVSWSPEMRGAIERAIDRHGFLAGYAFDS